MQDQPPVVDTFTAPELYVSHLLRTEFEAGVMKLTFTSNQSSGGPLSQVVVVRLAMPIAGAEAAASFMLEQLGKMKAALAPPPPETPRH